MNLLKVFLLLFFQVVCYSTASSASDSEEKVTEKSKKILALGGNGFIGSGVLHHLMSKGTYKEVILSSRGNWHYDSETRIKPHVTHLICDRGFEPVCEDIEDCDINALRHCPELMKIINETQFFDVVFDFSAYQAKWVHDAIEVLTGKVGVYIYISSDAVYEVSDPKTTDRPSEESDAVRPKDLETKRRLINADRYGDAKLSGEEALKDQQENGGFPWVALRLADVYGPRDTTTRWSLYQSWLKFHSVIGSAPKVPTSVIDTKESFTYVDDVVQAIDRILEKGPEVWNEAYNIAVEEVVTLGSILERMSKAMGLSLTAKDFLQEGDFYLYPTVFAGPMSIQKAKDRLGFVPSDLDSTFKSTVEWYDHLFLHDDHEREEMIARLLQNIIPPNKKNQFYLAVDAELSKVGLTVEKFRLKRKGEIEEDFVVIQADPFRQKQSRDEF